MGIRMWLFFQSLEQLKKCFGDNAGTVLDNLATQQYFSINSYETAEAMSKRIGDETIVIRTEGGNSGISTPIGGDGKSPGNRNERHAATNTSEIARRLLKPEEILVLPEHTAIVFHKNNYVIVCNKIKYYADRAFRRRGILFRRWGTGRTRGLGLGEMLLALAALAVAFVVTMIVTEPAGAGPGRLPPLLRRVPTRAGLPCPRPCRAAASSNPGCARKGRSCRFYPREGFRMAEQKQASDKENNRSVSAATGGPQQGRRAGRGGHQGRSVGKVWNAIMADGVSRGRWPSGHR